MVPWWWQLTITGNKFYLSKKMASLIAQLVKTLPAMQRPWFDSWVGKKKKKLTTWYADVLLMHFGVFFFLNFSYCILQLYFKIHHVNSHCVHPFFFQVYWASLWSLPWTIYWVVCFYNVALETQWKLCQSLRKERLVISCLSSHPFPLLPMLCSMSESLLIRLHCQMDLGLAHGGSGRRLISKKKGAASISFCLRYFQ